MEAVARYLDRYAEPEAATAAEVPGTFEHAVVIPACAEGEAPAHIAESVVARATQRMLVVIVLNARTSHDASVVSRTRVTLDTVMRSRFRAVQLPQSRGARPAYYGEACGVGCLVLDCFSKGHQFPDDQGVGLARKLGADVVLALYASGRLGSGWIHFTDADVSLPSDYAWRVTATNDFNTKSAVAALYPFIHVVDGLSELHQRAALTYDAYLRYHVAGLRFAASPFAFHNIGSTMAVRAQAYAEVQGCPKLQAGEDFYLLAKLAKLGTLVSLAGAPLALSARRSQRVPFGTGAALTRMLDVRTPQPCNTREATAPLRAVAPTTLTWPAYHPHSYEYLHIWHEVLQQYAESPSVDALDRILVQSCTNHRALGSGATLEISLLRRTLLELDAERAITSAHAKAKTPAARLRHMLTWFDAFRTLKFMHTLRDLGLFSLPTPAAIQTAAFLDLASQSDIAAQQRALAHIEERLLPLAHGLS